MVKAFAFQPSQPGSIRAGVINVWNGSIRSIDAVLKSGKGNARSNVFLFFFLFENLALQLGLGQRCQPERNQLHGSSFFAYDSDIPLRLIAAACVTSAQLASRELIA